jgi:hypothetical protein
MADNLTDGAEARILNFLTGNAPATAPTLPLMVRLMTANGSDSAPGTEVVNGGGSTYAPQSAAFPAASGTTLTANSADVVFANMPAIGGSGIVGVEIWDSAGTPFRWWWGAVTLAKTSNLGDTARILAGALVLNMQ